MTQDILQYTSTIWNTADLLRGSGIKKSEWPSYMMPFFALVMIESRLLRMLDTLTAEHGADFLATRDQNDLFVLSKGDKQGYNRLIFEQGKTLREICRNDKAFEVDFEGYLKAFDSETRDLLGVDAGIAFTHAIVIHVIFFIYSSLIGLVGLRMRGEAAIAFFDRVFNRSTEIRTAG